MEREKRSRNNDGGDGADEAEDRSKRARAQDGSPAEVTEFGMSDFDVVAFDLDHTLVRYALGEVSQLIFDALKRFLSEETEGRYSSVEGAEGVEKLEFDATFGGRGTILDRAKGNLLKLCHGRRVEVAVHGASKLSAEEIAEAYPEPLDVDNAALATERFWPLCSFFEQPAAFLVSSLVEYLDRRHRPRDDGERAALYRQLFGDLLGGFNFNFDSFGRGWYFPVLSAGGPDAVTRYIYPRPGVRKWLEGLRAEGKLVALVTNSKADYATLLLDHAFGKDWRRLFDITVVHAQKGRGFFRQERPFLRADARTGAEFPAEVGGLDGLARGGMYAAGSSALLDRFFARETGKERPAVIYWGDHLGSDIHATDTLTPWRAGAVIEEVEQFWGTGGGAALRDSAAFGSFFFAGDSTPSFWYEHLQLHAALVVPDIATLAALPAGERFRCRRGTPECFQGARPRPPKRDL